MRVFVAGASGALGRRLVAQLIDAGHEVVGTHNSPASAEPLRTLGAKPVMLDLLDARRGAQGRARDTSPRRSCTRRPRWRTRSSAATWTATFARTNELRTEGHRRAARGRAGGAACAASSRRASRRYRYAREGGPVKTEDDPLDPDPPRQHAQSLRRDGATSSGRSPTSAGSRFATAASTAPPTTAASSRCASGSSRSSATAAASVSWIHLDDAAAATVLALEHDGPGDLQHRRRRARARARVAAGARGGPGRQAAAALPGLARAAGRRRGRGGAWAPRRGARRTRRPSASSAGRRATRAGGRGSRPPTRRRP